MREQEKNIQDELQELSPFLAKLRKIDDGFEVPQNYFQHFENNLMARIKAEEEAESWHIPNETIREDKISWSTKIVGWLKTPRMAIGFAMMVLIGIAVAIFIPPSDKNQGNILADISIEAAISNVSAEEMLAYVEDNVEEFDAILLSEVVEENVEMVEETIEVPTFESIETEELKEYLDNNIEEFDNSLIEEEMMDWEEEL